MDEPKDLTGILAEYLGLCADGRAAEAAALLAAHPELDDVLPPDLDVIGVLEAALAEGGVPEVSIPDQVGDYRIVRELGRGGMGVVYEAEQVSMERRVALKVLTPTLTTTGRAVKRFQREAKAAGRLHHTNIVPVFGMGQDGGHWFYAMELVRGRALSDVLHDLRMQAPAHPSESGLGAFSGSGSSGQPAARPGSQADGAWFRRVADVFAGVADALHTAHEEGVVHRDVKPSNLLLDDDGTLKIVDFGLAHLDQPGPAMTLTGDLVGTPAYMSPEQAMAKRIALDHRTDIYSLGATLYEVLTLRPPFDGASLQELCSQIITKDPALPRRVDQSIPRDLETIVLKAMEKDRDKRYQRAADLAEDLKRFAMGGAITARRVGVVERSWRMVRRHPRTAALVGLVAASAIVAGIYVHRALDERDRRRDAEYTLLLSEAQQRFAAAVLDGEPGFGEPDDHDVEQVLGHAIELSPGRAEAWWMRALLPVRAAEDRAADVEAAARRGLAPADEARLRRYVTAGFDDGNDELEVADPSASALSCYLAARILMQEAGRRWSEAIADGRLIRAEADEVSELRDRSVPLLERAIRMSAPATALRALARADLAGALTRERDYERALEQWMKVEGAGLREPFVYAEIACLWRRRSSQESSELHLQKAVAEARARGRAWAWNRAFWAVYKARFLDWQVEIAAAAAEDLPEHAALLTNLGRLLVSSARRAKPSDDLGVRAMRLALECTAQARALDPTSAKAILWNCQAASRLFDLTGAEEDRQAAIRIWRECPISLPDDAELARTRALNLGGLEARALALAAWQEIQQRAPHPMADHTIPYLLTELGRYEDAIAAVDAALPNMPDATPAQRSDRRIAVARRGFARLELGQVAEALPDLQLAAAPREDGETVFDSFVAGISNKHALALAALGRLDDALEELDRSLAILGPQRPGQKYYQTQRLYQHQRGLLARRRELERSLAATAAGGQDLDAKSWSRLAETYVDVALPEFAQDPEKGFYYVVEAMHRSDADDAAVLAVYGQALFADGQAGEAADIAVRALVAVPGDYDGKRDGYLREILVERLAQYTDTRQRGDVEGRSAAELQRSLDLIGSAATTLHEDAGYARDYLRLRRCWLLLALDRPAEAFALIADRWAEPMADGQEVPEDWLQPLREALLALEEEPGRDAICAAVHVGFVAGSGSDEQRRTARDRARRWLRRSVERDPESLAELLADERLAPTRDEARLDALPADEAEAWSRFWEEVRATIEKSR